MTNNQEIQPTTLVRDDSISTSLPISNTLELDLKPREEKETVSESCTLTSPAGEVDTPPDGGLTAWLVVLACFLLSFNGLGVTYSFGMLIFSVL